MSSLSRFLSAILLAVVVCAASLSPASASQNAQAVAAFRRAGLLGAKTSITQVRVVKPIKNLSASQRALVAASNQSNQKVRAAQTSPLKFNVTGYDTTVVNGSSPYLKVSTFLANNYNTFVSVWGEPSPAQQGKTVQVVGNNAVDAAYAPPTEATSNSGGGGFLFYRFQNNATDEVNQFNLTRLVFLAFWGPSIPSYNFNEAQLVEPWVYGMSDAAAVQVMYLLSGSSPKFTTTGLTLDFLPIYDFLNRPELGNAFIYSPVESDGNPPANESSISLFRLPMAMDAFIKVGVENPNFWKNFNAQLYAQTSPRIAVSPEQLKSIAAGVVPTVEGLGFQDWARRQYVLDNTITTGAKLYPAVLPDTSTTADPRPGFVYYVESFTTNAQGQSVATAPGYGSIRVYDALGNDVTNRSTELAASNVLNFVNTDFVGEASGGVGFDAIASGSQQRLLIKFRNGNVESTAYFPLGVVGSQTSTSTFYGATIGPVSGTISLSGAVTESVPLTLGAFTSTKTYPTGPRVQTTLTVNGQTFKRNTAYLVPLVPPQDGDLRSVGFLLDVQSGANGTFTVTAPAGTDKLRMVSFPFFPTQTDEAAVLGVDPSTLKMARYRPNLAPAQRVGDNLVFGINGDRHEIYPNIAQPIKPGRGYWLETGTSGLSKTAQGTEPSTSQPFEVPLLGGWNQFGVPFNRTFNPAAVQVRYGGFAPVAFDVAVSRGWVATGIWRWLPGGGYERADSAGNLQPYEGYYIFAGPSNGISLVFDPNAAVTVQSAATRSGWSVQLMASNSKGRDSANRFGVSNDISVAKPPTATRRVSLRFTNVDNGNSDAAMAASKAASAGAGFAEAYQPKATIFTDWHAIVDGTDKGDRVTVSWGSLSQVPSNMILTIRDDISRKSQTMLSGGTFSYTSTGGVRLFTILMRPKPGASLSSPSAKSVNASE